VISIAASPEGLFCAGDLLRFCPPGRSRPAAAPLKRGCRLCTWGRTARE